jgi:archaetidylinositol phosphate synthase
MLQTRVFEHLGSHPERILTGVVSRHEARLLKRIALLMPAAVTPNSLTLLGVFGAVLTGVSAALSWHSDWFLLAALIGLVINWFGDSLDGTLARVRNIERPRYGFFVDHLSDVVSQIVIVLGLGLSPYLRFDMVCIALIAYLVVTIYTLVKLQVFRNMQLTYFGVGPTEVRVIIGLAIVAAAVLPTPHFSSFIGVVSPFDLAALFVAVFATGSVAVMAYWDSSQLAALDPPRGPPARPHAAMRKISDI